MGADGAYLSAPVYGDGKIYVTSKSGVVSVTESRPEPKTDTGKIFAGCYALYCGLVFLFIAGLLVTPVAHRLLHLFHADPDEAGEQCPTEP